jgi:hypothetical protein
MKKIEKEHILWILQEAPKLIEGKDFREDNWSVIREKLIEKLQEPDQSQKQPEGIEYVNSNPEGTVIPESITTYTKPEKQEEWREELDNLILQSGYVRNKNKEVGSEYEKFVSHISQLLSERTFNKEELDYIKGACYMWSKEVNEHNPIKEEFRDTSKIDAFNKKLSKLLKEEENV